MKASDTREQLRQWVADANGFAYEQTQRAEAAEERVLVLTRALERAGTRITYLQDGWEGPPPMWIQEVLRGK